MDHATDLHRPAGPEWRCASCGSSHTGLSYAFAAPAPDAWVALRWWRRGRRSVLSGEQCVIRDEHFFIRGVVEIPVIGGDEPVFAWNVWSSLSRESFERASELWDSPERVNEPPAFGWMSVELAPIYPPTTNLELSVHTRELGIRPFLEVVTDHPLAVEQREGIRVERVRELNELMLHRR
jgi:hypothetical protein